MAGLVADQPIILGKHRGKLMDYKVYKNDELIAAFATDQFIDDFTDHLCEYLRQGVTFRVDFKGETLYNYGLKGS